MSNNTDLSFFYLSRLNTLYADREVRKGILACRALFPAVFFAHFKTERELFDAIMYAYIEEAQESFLMLGRRNPQKKDAILEIGGGIGLSYGFLKHEGYAIYSVEPSRAGFQHQYTIALSIFRALGLDASGYYPLLAEDCGKIGMTFDYIYSYYVLEHVEDIRTVFAALGEVLRSGGVMVHQTVNYVVPYEPHTRSFLVPLFPRITSLIKPALLASPFWDDLNFVTVPMLKKACRTLGLSIQFEKGILVETFSRFEKESGFSVRQHRLLLLYRILKKTRLLGLISFLPILFTTPIRCYMRHTGASD